MRTSAAIVCIALAATALVRSQEPATTTAPSKTDTLRTLISARDGIRAALDDQRKKLQSETSDAVKRDLQQQIDTLEMRRQEVEQDFSMLATGVQSAGSSNATTKAAQSTLQDEIGQILTPIFADLRQLTQKTRTLQELEDERARLEDSQSKATRAIAELDKLLAGLKSPKAPDVPLRNALADARKTWQGTLDDTRSRTEVVELQLKELRSSRLDFWSELGASVRHFVFIRGTNIILALLVFLAVFFGLRTAYSYLVKVIPVRRVKLLSFPLRIMDVAHGGVSMVAGIAAALLLLYARGDWLLGGISLLALGGLLVSAKAGIAKHLNQLQFLLNLGPVREGERVVINGVPWRVGPIRMFTQLTNRVIGGAGLRLPLEALGALTSRADSADEPWFPCVANAWIVLNGSSLAQVTSISPDRVELTFPGGSRRSMPVAAFLAADVMDLSAGFNRTATVAIHTSHQPRISEIAEQLKNEVLKSMPEGELRAITVELDSVSGLSLNLLITATFSGAQAPHYQSLARALQRAALDSSTRNGWGTSASV